MTLDDLQGLYGDDNFTCCCAGVGCGDPWHKIIPKLIAVARTARSLMAEDDAREALAHFNCLHILADQLAAFDS